MSPEGQEYVWQRMRFWWDLESPTLSIAAPIIIPKGFVVCIWTTGNLAAPSFQSTLNVAKKATAIPLNNFCLLSIPRWQVQCGIVTSMYITEVKYKVDTTSVEFLFSHI